MRDDTPYCIDCNRSTSGRCPAHQSFSYTLSTAPSPPPMNLHEMSDLVRRSQAEREKWEADMTALLERLDTITLDDFAVLVMKEQSKRYKLFLDSVGKENGGSE